jgi:hypothetical protein
MKCVRQLVTCVSIALLVGSYAWAQIPPPPPQPCLDSQPSPYEDAGPACAPLDGNFSTAVPLIDGNVTKIWPTPPLPNGQIVTLYGSYGNSESSGLALTHFNQGTAQANLIHPLCTDGSLPQNNTCPDGKAPASQRSIQPLRTENSKLRTGFQFPVLVFSYLAVLGFYSSSSFTSPRSAFALSMIFSCS